MDEVPRVHTVAKARAVLDDADHIAAIVKQTRARGYATIRRSRSNPTRSFAAPFFYYRSAMTEAQAI
jgi:DNA-binding IclR family transcriptional regulator